MISIQSKNRGLQIKNRMALKKNIFSLTRLICFLVVFARFPAAIFAQPTPVKFDRLTVEDGLAHYRVLQIVQDRKGFLWFATPGGLSRISTISKIRTA